MTETRGLSSTDPFSAEDWTAVANQRAADAAAMLPQRADSVGPVYMAGYAVECALKAYLQRRGIPRPRSGPAGHDLRGLWRASGFRLADLNDEHGLKSFYIEAWSTDLRYAIRLDPATSVEPADLVEGARLLSSWIQNQVRRQRRRRR